MQVLTRTGTLVAWNREKIANAVRAAFASVGSDTDSPIIDEVSREVERRVIEGGGEGEPTQVEAIQDLVERALVDRGCHAEVRSYILYREEHARRRAARTAILDAGPFVGAVRDGLDETLRAVSRDYPEAVYSLDFLSQKFGAFVGGASARAERPERRSDGAGDDASNAANAANAAFLLAQLARAAIELTTREAPKWEYVASRVARFRLGLELSSTRCSRGWTRFSDMVAGLADEGLYGAYIAEAYTGDELDEAAGLIDDARDKLLTFSALDLLSRRYAIRLRSGEAVESPQEAFLGIALHLAMEEPSDRLGWVKRFYDEMSLLRVTVATPTLSNARKPLHQLSSCFVDTVPDSLDGIYRSVSNFAQVSKFGGGMGMYFGKVRAVGGPIRGFPGVAGGVLRWIKLANDTAVAVDQLGMRQGSVAVWLDAWHKDLPEFLQLRTNNGDDRMKAHDVFPGVCYPDLFWKTVRNDIDADWHLMCPHEILTVKGWSLEDTWGGEWEARYRECVADARISKRTIPLKELVRLILKSAVETGTPFAFNRDLVNRMNPNGHAGMIYCSNLCTEIAQNMGAAEFVSRETRVDGGETVVVETTKGGDFVVCNLASVVLGNVDVDEPAALERTVSVAVRMLDNVIDLNFYPVPYAEITNRTYRAIGLGVSGYHHLLARKGVKWEGEGHLAFAEDLFARLARAAILASSSLARERGSYSLFDGSDWQTGAYFDKRGYDSPEWNEVRARVASDGMRNAWLLAVAPTSSTSVIAGTTAGIDPVMKPYYLEEKRGSITPRVAPELSAETMWYYKSAHHIDQTWSVRAAGARQRHVDQSQSLNLYVTTEFSLRGVLELYVRAWEEGVKTIYYVRSQSLEVEECESCAN